MTIKRTILIFAAMMSFAVAAAAQTTVEEHMENARKIAKTRNFSGAAVEVGKAIALEPTNAELYLTRANYHLIAKEWAGLRADVAKAWQLEASEMTIGRASRLLDTGFEEDCRMMLAMATTFLEKNSQSDKAYEARFRAKTCLGDTAGAFNDISMAAELAPDHPTHKVNVGRMISRFGDHAEAIRLQTGLINRKTDELAAADPKNKDRIKRELWGLLMGRVSLYERQNNYESALADVNSILELRLHAESALLRFRAKFHSRNKRHDAALADINSAIEKRADNKYADRDLAFWERADLLVAAGRLAEAIEAYEETRRIMPGNDAPLEARIAAVRKQMEAAPR
jgi:hypothetical protein